MLTIYSRKRVNLLDYKLLITRQNNKIISSLFEEKDLIQVNIDDANTESLLGNIYVGKVKNIIKNINAAFVEIADGKMCYLSISDNMDPIFCNKKKDNKVNIGDELIVQVMKEDVKTKAPVVTCNINFTGKYVVLTHGKTRVGVSNKITSEQEKTRLKSIISKYKSHAYGFILRTNALGAERQLIEQEIETVINLYDTMCQYGVFKTRFSVLYEAPSNFICDIRDGIANKLSAIITDDREFFEQINQYLSMYQKEDLKKLRFYEDSILSLNSLYGINGKIADGLKEKVWMKSGANLVIQPTEALTVIDVNSSKAVKGKNQAEETFFKINLEAATEIARQVRLRNLSGIIIIDFIDMDSTENQNIILRNLETLFMQDSVKTTVVDMTKLNLVEITRKKLRKPLYEQCSGLTF